jgi:hypothetical protein
MIFAWSMVEHTVPALIENSAPVGSGESEAGLLDGTFFPDNCDRELQHLKF